MGVEDRGALEAAVAVAAAHGVHSTDPVILRDQLNVLVLLRPAPIVARVAGTIAYARPGTAWLERELSVASQLARAGAPVVAPCTDLPAGPHTHNGRVMSFWRHVEVTGERVDPVAAGEALRDCHAALRHYDGALPLLSGVTEAEALLAKLVIEDRIAPEDANELQLGFATLTPLLKELRSPVQPLHGDAHLNNVLNGPEGPLWNDWEDTCLGPVGWDAACLLCGRDGGERAEAALAASAISLDPGERELWIEARSLQIAVWRAMLRSLQAQPRR